jgi:hypothetical protein
MLVRETVYRKTAAGAAAIAQRDPALGARERPLLIMIDGRRGEAELAALGNLEEMLPALLARGFIEPVERDSRSADSRPMDSRAPDSRSADSRPPETVPPSENDDLITYTAAKRLAVRRLNELLGPAAEDLCIRIEKARSAQEYLAALRHTEAWLRQALGAQAASRFAREVGKVRTD